jgi:imidazolonepropionase-like amidohydrolase
MKKLFFIINISFYFLYSFGQIKFSAEVKKFIDYDTAIIAFQHALLIDGTGSAAKPNQTVIIKNGKIDWVGDDAKAAIPKGSQVIDLTGKSILPGLVMLHEHMYSSASAVNPSYLHLNQLPVSFPRLYLAAGATTIRTCGSIEPYSDIRIKKDIDAGMIVGPTMELTAPYLEGKFARFPQMKELKNEDEAIRFVNYWADEGFTSFKAYIGIEKNVLKAAINAAHKRGLKVTGHLCSVTYREAAELGIDQLEHGFSVSSDFVPLKKENECPSVTDVNNSFARLDPESDSIKSFLSFLIRKKVAITSTLLVREGSTTSHMADPDVLNMLATDSRDYYLQRVLNTKSVKGPTPADKAFSILARIEKLFYDAGGLLAVGTDPTGNGGVIAGYGNWRNIELLVEAAGFTNLEAIKIATLNGAIALGLDKITGTIEKGKEADLVVIDGDPSKKISDIRKVVWVFKDGVGFNSKRLFESVKGKVGFY